MSSFVTVAPPNSMILVMDSQLGEVPTSFDAGAIAANNTCVALGTLMEFDGDSTIHLVSTNDKVQLPPEVQRVWTGFIETAGTLGVWSVDRSLLLSAEATGLVGLDIWTNDPVEPDKIWIIIESV